MESSPDRPAGVPHESDWVMPPVAPADGAPGAAAAPRRDRRAIGTGVGLLAVGALAGWLAVSAVGGSTTPQATAANSPVAGAPNGAPNGGTDGGTDGSGRFRGGPGGFAGEQRLQGTLTAVGDASVTVRTSTGTATYAVTGTTQIVRDGAPAALSDLKVGETVLVHVYPVSGDGSLAVERIFAGSMPSFGGGGLPPGGRGPGGDGQDKRQGVQPDQQGQQGQEQGTTT